VARISGLRIFFLNAKVRHILIHKVFTGCSTRYPAAYGEGTTGESWELLDANLIVAVAAIDAEGNRAGFTSFGNWIDVSAYGVGLMSTALGVDLSQYSSYSGTSAAAPMVAGLAGLMKSYAPSKSADEIISCLKSTSNSDIYNSTNHPDNIPNTLGFGRIDAYQALLCLNQSCQSPSAVIFPSILNICPGTTETLTANEGISYLWSTSETTRSIDVNAIGTYTVTVTFAGNCTASKSITVKNSPVEAVAIVTEGGEISDEIICGDDLFSISVVWGSTYTWEEFGIQPSSLLLSRGDNVGTATFNITVTDVAGCIGVTDVVTKTLILQDYPIPTIQTTEISGIQNDGLICIGSPVTLKASGGNNFLWSNGATTPTINVNPTVTTTYTVTVTSGTCSSTKEQIITVSTCQPADDCSSCLPSGIKITANNIGTKYSTLNLPTTISLPTCLSISGKLIIDVDVSILNTQIILGSGAEIIVGDANNFNPVTLNIQGCLLASCNQMWKGIKVLSPHHLVFKDNEIFDAEYAITAIPSSGSSPLSPSTTVEIVDNKFYENHVGFYVPYRTWWGVVRHFPFSGNEFIKRPFTNLKPPTDINLANYNSQKCFAGIIIDGLAEFTLGSPGNTGYDNVFKNIRNGIISSGSTWLSVYRAHFDELNDYFGSSGIASVNNATGIGVLSNNGISNVYSSGFNKCGHGVYANSGFLGVYNNQMPEVNIGVQTNFPIAFSINEISQPQQYISFKYNALLARNLNKSLFSDYKVENNRFSNNLSGFDPDLNNPEAAIDIDNANNPNMEDGRAKINDNIIDLTDFYDGVRLSNLNNWGIHDNFINFVDNATAISKGIILNNANATYLLDNAISCSYTNPNPLGTRGIQVNLSAQTEFCCNHTIGTTVGTEFVGPCENTDLKTGDFSNNVYNVKCNVATVIGDQPNMQLNSIENNGNVFNGTSGTAEHLGNNALISDSEFYVKDESLPHYPPTVSTPNAFSPWFIEIGKEPITCTSCPEPQKTPRGDRVLDTDLHFVDGTYGDSQFGDMIEWEGQLRLFDQLKKTPKMVNINSTVANFYSIAESSAIGQYWEVDKEIEKISELSRGGIISLGSVWDTIKTYESLYTSTLESLSSVTEPEERNLILRDADQVRTKGYLYYHSFMQKKHHTDSLIAIQRESTLVLNESLPEENILQYNRKQVNKAYLHFMGSHEISNDDFSAISSIAHQCPLEGGSAVYKARNLYQIREKKYFDDNISCHPDGNYREFNATKSSFEWFNLVPNPTNSSISVIVPNSITDNSIIGLKLVDMNGRIVLNPVIVYTTGMSINLDVSNLQNGLYHCLISENGKPVATSKLIIQH
jgi:hypothetical protein